MLCPVQTTMKVYQAVLTIAGELTTGFYDFLVSRKEKNFVKKKKINVRKIFGTMDVILKDIKKKKKPGATNILTWN